MQKVLREVSVELHQWQVLLAAMAGLAMAPTCASFTMQVQPCRLACSSTQAVFQPSMVCPASSWTV
jgi:hypothetical protein